MNDLRLQELMDACPPGHSDWQSPDLQDLAQRIVEDPAVAAQWEQMRQSDFAIAQALRDVPVPDGLEQRLLQSVARAPVSLGADDQDIADGALAEIQSSSASGRSQVTPSLEPKRRRWGMALALALSVVATIALVVTSRLSPIGNPTSATPRDLAQQATQWINVLTQGEWQDNSFPANEFPLPMDRTFDVIRWQRLSSTPDGDRVIGCELATADPGRALLFVIAPARAAGVPDALPLSPYPTATGWQVGSWRANGCLYVLALEGPTARYQRWSRPQRNAA